MYVKDVSRAQTRVQPLEACPDPKRMGEFACANRHQCWEPCGELGHSEEFVGVVDAATEKEILDAVGVRARTRR